MRIDQKSYNEVYLNTLIQVIRDLNKNSKIKLNEDVITFLYSLKDVTQRGRFIFNPFITDSFNNLNNYLTMLFNGSCKTKDKDNRFYVLDTNSSMFNKYWKDPCLTKIIAAYGKIVPNLNLLRLMIEAGNVPIWYSTRKDGKAYTYLRKELLDEELLDKTSIDFTVKDINEHLTEVLRKETENRYHSVEPEWELICKDVEIKTAGKYELVYYTDKLPWFMKHPEDNGFHNLFKHHPDLNRISWRILEDYSSFNKSDNIQLAKSFISKINYGNFILTSDDCSDYIEIRMLRKE